MGETFIAVLPIMIDLQKEKGQPLNVVIDGDHRGKDAATLLSFLHAETGESYEDLAKKFVFTRRDVYRNDLENGLSINPKDEQQFEMSFKLDERKFKPAIEILRQDIRDPNFKKALGVCQRVDIGDPTLPLPSAAPNVRFAMQILQYLSPAQRLDYVRNLARTQTPGSLLVLGSNEGLSEPLLIASPMDHMLMEMGVPGFMNSLETMKTMVPMHRELEKLGYEPIFIQKPGSGSGKEGSQKNDWKFIYKKVRDVPVPGRDPKIETLIHSQVLKEHPEFAIRLSRQGFDLDALDPNDGQALLHLAAQQNLSDVVQALLDAGAKGKVLNAKNKRPFELVPKTNKDLIKQLKKAK